MVYTEIMQKPLKKYCELCNAPVIPQYGKYGKKVWYYPKRCPKCFRKITVPYNTRKLVVGEKHHWFKPEGSKIIHNTGNHQYIKIKKSGKWKYEHRVIMEQLLDRLLLKNEIVHHINENTLDNRPGNLQLFSCMGDHIKHHSLLKPKKQCSVPGCTRPNKGLGYCIMHYRRFKKHGDPLYKKV